MLHCIIISHDSSKHRPDPGFEFRLSCSNNSTEFLNKIKNQCTLMSTIMHVHSGGGTGLSGMTAWVKININDPSNSSNITLI